MALIAVFQTVTPSLQIFSANKALNQRFSEIFPEACKDDSCWASEDTAGFLEKREGCLDEH
ncbi:MAG: hypothetical protein KME46_11185 [Brasilonema angustatum HA4187-MV1]|nr:hypothetical protein [Brasilonema angustatum HA4187-MV1]